MDRKEVLIQVMALLAGMLCTNCSEFPVLQMALEDALAELAEEDQKDPE